MQKTASQISDEVLEKLALSPEMRGAALVKGLIKNVPAGGTPSSMLRGIRTMGQTQPRTLKSFGMTPERGVVTPSGTKSLHRQFIADPGYAEESRVLSHFNVPEISAMLKDNPAFGNRMPGLRRR